MLGLFGDSNFVRNVSDTFNLCFYYSWTRAIPSNTTNCSNQCSNWPSLYVSKQPWSFFSWLPYIFDDGIKDAYAIRRNCATNVTNVAFYILDFWAIYLKPLNSNVSCGSSNLALCKPIIFICRFYEIIFLTFMMVGINPY